jgi:hypothetical protein
LYRSSGKIFKYTAAVENIDHPFIRQIDIFPEKGQCYSLYDIFEDYLSIDISELIAYRGPILRDIWVDPDEITTKEREEGLQDPLSEDLQLWKLFLPYGTKSTT